MVRHEDEMTSPSRRSAYLMCRVWWPPTDDPDRTGYSGMYWPAKVLKRDRGQYTVEYDNGDTEAVDLENVSPADVPVGFGQEKYPFVAGEFVEVSNGSATDPGAWLGRIKTITGPSTYTVEYPFHSHDEQPDSMAASMLRRVRVYDAATQRWQYIRPGQTWDDGEVTSPMELEMVDEGEMYDIIMQAAVAAQQRTMTHQLQQSGTGVLCSTEPPSLHSTMARAAQEAAWLAMQSGTMQPHSPQDGTGSSNTQSSASHAPSLPSLGRRTAAKKRLHETLNAAGGYGADTYKRRAQRGS